MTLTMLNLILTTLNQSLNEKENLNLESLNQWPTRYYCRHRALYETAVLRRIIYLNMTVACIMSCHRILSI